MNYRSVADLDSDIRRWISEFPTELDLVVGIPRSGLLVANLIALHLNVAITDVEGFCQGRIIQAGKRLGSARVPDLSRALRVLVVDDSVCSGTQMESVRKRLKQLECLHDITYAAVYVSPKGHRWVDLWYEIVDLPRVFEWNVMHHSMLPRCCMDIDGVLCRDPTSRENDDGPRYREFIANVPPLIVPTQRIGWLVTCRLEKYRELTETWLTKHGFRFEHLMMMDLPDMKTRMASGNHASFKAEVYASTGSRLFIESSRSQAQQIAEMTHKPVYCVETAEMLTPDSLTNVLDRAKRSFASTLSDPIRAPQRLAGLAKAKLKTIAWKTSAILRRWRQGSHPR